jgi:glycopeptide antibiotics resistance protein
MKKLCVAFIVLATLGSIYPFDFQVLELDSATIGRFLQSCCKMPSRGDVLGNVILFVPIGFTGMLATRLQESAVRRLVFVCLVAGIVALALQVLQLFLPSRDANLQDVVWNLFGTAGGAALAQFVGLVSPPSERNRVDASLVPLTLIGTWLIYRLIPFVPSLDLQLIKDSLKPLLDIQFVPVNIVHDTTAWLVVAYLLRQVRRDIRLDTYLPLLIVTVFGLEVLIVDNSVNFSSVAGALVAVLLWRGVLSDVKWQEIGLVILLLVTVAVAGLAPFEISSNAVHFNWIPFRGFLGGSMYLNTQSAAEKVFLYGALVYVLWRTSIGLFGGIIASVAFVAMVELAQTRLVGHTPEITDPLLVIFAAITLLVIQREDVKSGPVGRPDASLPLVSPRKNRRKWVEQAVNLRGYQSEFLVQLSQEMGGNVSEAISRIVAEFVASLEQDSELEFWAQRDRAIESDTNGERREIWVTQSIKLQAKQYRFLFRLSQEMGVSVSRVTRRIVSRFIDGLDVPED